MSRKSPNGSQLLTPSPEATVGTLALRKAAPRTTTAPRGRTGCVTCRMRRVKCDETKPVCRRCQTSRRTCSYGILQQPRQPNPVEIQAALLRQSQAGPSLRATPPTDAGRTISIFHNEHSLLRARDWDYVDAWRYYVQVVCQRFVAVKEDLDCVHDGMRDYDKNAVILITLSDYVSTVSKAQKCLPEEGQLVALNPVWRTLWQYVQATLECINSNMQSTSYRNKSTALFRITDLTATEFRLLGTAWQPHMRGYFALMQHGEGYVPLIEKFPFLQASLNWMLNAAVAANSHSPANNQITEIYNWDFDTLRAIRGTRIDGFFPCPGNLFIDIIRITRLRTLLASGASLRRTVTPAAQAIFDQAASYISDEWVELCGPTEMIPENRSIFSLFQTAVILYGVLSLSPRNTSFQIYRQSRQELRDLLMAKMRYHMQYKNAAAHLSWAVSVVVVALSDGSQADKQFIEGLVMNERGDRGEYYVPLAFLKKYRDFWASGKTHWDDMYPEATAPLGI